LNPVTSAILQGYAAASASLIRKFDAISSVELYAPVRHLLPEKPSRIVDIGAGTGRDAAWLASQGHDVVAVEPVAAFREAGRARHRSPRIAWLDDSLPNLTRLGACDRSFDLVVLSAVWQHLDDGQRRIALPKLRAVTATGGLLILSIRNGPGAASRPVYAARPSDAVAWAAAQGFRHVFDVSSPSVQSANRAAGVCWTWLALQAD
jgi:SAM-dependent methyltransferase|tara:strand:+ start:6055 stop:6672 length:618 start_codon:yes stop_codon:yes gene_type:complete